VAGVPLSTCPGESQVLERTVKKTHENGIQFNYLLNASHGNTSSRGWAAQDGRNARLVGRYRDRFDHRRQRLLPAPHQETSSAHQRARKFASFYGYARKVRFWVDNG